MARKPRAATVLCLALAVSAFPAALRAHVEPMSVRDLAAASPHIVVATVEEGRSRWNGFHTLILTDYTLRVEERLRGEAPDRITITVPGGTVGKIADDTCISVHLETGARYLLFLGDLGRPTLMPVTGANQGVFREEPGTRSGAFQDLVATARSLAARVPLETPRPLPPAAAGLPSKAWIPGAPPAPIAGSLPPRAAPEAALPPAPEESAAETVEIAGAVSTPPRPAAGKFLYEELAPRPVVVNPLTDATFAPWDQYEMAYWNRYSGDLFRVSASPTPTWAYGNGVSDIVGFLDDAPMKQHFEYDWNDLGKGVLAVTFARYEEGAVVEADVVLNPHKSWTLDDLEATGSEPIYAFKEVVLHELGHVWGLLHPWDDEVTWVTWDSVMNYKPRQFYVWELFADDTAAVRHAFPPGVPLRDGVISSYVTVRNPRLIIPNYQTALPSPSTVRAGGAFGLAGPVKIENVGTVPLIDPIVEIYLAPARLSFDGAVLLQRAKVRGKIPSGGTLQVKLKGLKVPRGTPPGTYYPAYLLRDPKDAYQDNNAAWGLEEAAVTVAP
ncbi:MAG: hypothetical protein ACJ76Y_04575 [Thermoanaerobaculia bacterium]